MASVEGLARLTAGAVDLSRGSLSAGAPAFAGIEIAGFLAGLHHGPMLLCQAKFMGDADSLKLLQVFHYSYLLSESNFYEWGCRSETLMRLAKVSVDEVINDRCERCHGTKFVKGKVCAACDGTGFRSVSEVKVSAAIGIKRDSYRRHWVGRYESAVAKVRSYEADIYRAVAKQNWQELIKEI